MAKIYSEKKVSEQFADMVYKGAENLVSMVMFFEEAPVVIHEDHAAYVDVNLDEIIRAARRLKELLRSQHGAANMKRLHRERNEAIESLKSRGLWGGSRDDE